MNNNLRAKNPLIYHAEVPPALHSDDSLPAAGRKRKFYREYKPREYSRRNKKANPKVEIHDLLSKKLTNGIWKFNPCLRFRELASFCNVHTSDLSKDDRVCTIGMFHRCSITYCKKTHSKSTYEEAKHMVNLLEQAIKNIDQIKADSAGDKSK